MSVASELPMGKRVAGYNELRPLAPRLYPAVMPKPSKTCDVPATKADIRMLMGEIGKLYEANERWKDEVIGTLDGRIAASVKRMKQHFDLALETIRADLVGANKDRIEDHEHRLSRLEQQAGIAR